MKATLKKILLWVSLGIVILFLGSYLYWKNYLRPAEPVEIGANSKKSIQLFSVRVLNERFPSLTPEQFEIFLTGLRKDIKEFINVDVDFQFTPPLPIERFFSRSGDFPGGQEELLRQYYDRFELKEIATEEDLKKSLEEFYEQSSNHIGKEDLADLISKTIGGDVRKMAKWTVPNLLEKVATRHLETYGQLEKIVLKDGNRIFDSGKFQEYPLWAANLKRFPEYSFIVTNQPLISRKEPGATLHTSLRGGITAGVSLPTATVYGSTILISTFPFIFEHEVLDRMRDFDLESEMMPVYLGAYATHEFGHAFAYWGHYFFQGCLMNPAAGLKLRQWYEETRKRENCKAEFQPDLREIYLSASRY